MSALFGRAWSVTVGTLLLEGFDIAGHIVKSLKPEPNTCELTVYNLNPEHRSALEELRPKVGDPRGIPCKIDAGYKDNQTSNIWLGDLRTVESYKDGSDWLTVLGSGDGEKAFQTSRINVPMGPGTTATTALTAIAKSLGVGLGNVATAAAEIEAKGFSSKLAHGMVISGQASRQMTDFARSAGLEWSIQDGSLQFVRRGATMPGQAVLLSPATGMLGSPTVDNEGVLTVRMLMIPDIRPGVLLVIDSERIQGGYRIETASWVFDTFGGSWEIQVEAKRY